MFDPLSPIYCELLRLQINEFLPFLHVTLKNVAISWICSHCNSECIGFGGSTMDIKVPKTFIFSKISKFDDSLVNFCGTYTIYFFVKQWKI